MGTSAVLQWSLMQSSVFLESAVSRPKGELDYCRGHGLLQPFTSTKCIANVNSIGCKCCDLLLEMEPDDRGAVGMCGWVQVQFSLLPEQVGYWQHGSHTGLQQSIQGD